MATFDIDGILDINSIEHAIRLAENHTSTYAGVDTKVLRSQELTGLNSLPKRDDLPGLKMDDSIVNGTLPIDLTSPHELQGLFARMKNALKGHGVFGVDAWFEERSSKQVKSTSDSVGVWLRRNRWYLDLMSTQSQIAKNKKYRQEMIAEIIKVVDLPIKMIEKRASFFLAHSEDAELSFLLAEGLEAANPTGFSCEIRNANEKSMIQRLNRFVGHFSGRIFRYRWSGGPFINAGKRYTSNDMVVYDVIREVNIPTVTGYLLRIDYRLVALKGLETLRNLCSPDDKLVNQIGLFLLEDGKRAELESVTTAQGHRLRIRLNRKEPEAAAAIAKKLQLKLVE